MFNSATEYISHAITINHTLDLIYISPLEPVTPSHPFVSARQHQYPDRQQSSSDINKTTKLVTKAKTRECKTNAKTNTTVSRLKIKKGQDQRE